MTLAPPHPLYPPGAFAQYELPAADRYLVTANDLIPTLLLTGLSSVFWMMVVAGGSMGQMLAAMGLLALGGPAAFISLSKGGLQAMPLLVYLCAVEPLSRKFTTGFPYLFLEYLLVGCAFFSMLTHRRRLRTNCVFMVLYLLLELLDLPRATAAHEFSNVTIDVVMHTAAKLALLMLMSNAELGMRGTSKLLRAFVVGTVTIAGYTVAGSVFGNVKWGTQANYESSGGMGPNQIGLMLAFGAFACLALAEYCQRRGARFVFLGLMALQTLGTLLTLTRGSTYALVACVLIYSLRQIILRPGASARSIILLSLLAAVGWTAVVVTDSMIVKRFEKKDFSGRDKIAKGAMEIFFENPVMGIGTGNFYVESAKRSIRKDGHETGMHNEAVRALTEHGAIGGALYFGFVLSSFVIALRGLRGQQRVLCGLWFALAIFSEVHSGLKQCSQVLQLAFACEAFRGGPQPGAAVIAKPQATDW